MYFSPNFLPIFLVFAFLSGIAHPMPAGESQNAMDEEDKSRDESMNEDKSGGENSGMEIENPREKTQIEEEILPNLDRNSKIDNFEEMEVEEAQNSVNKMPKFLENICENARKRAEELSKIGKDGKGIMPENELVLSTALAEYLCQKLKNEKSQNIKMPEGELELDMSEDKNIWSSEGLQGFSARGERIFDKINDKFGISAEQLLTSLSRLRVLKGGGKSGNLFYESADGEFIVKSLTESHDELNSLDAVLDNFAEYMLSEAGTESLMNKFHMAFRATAWYPVKQEDGEKVPKLITVYFVVLNNVFSGTEYEKLLKFDIKGTFSTGSAVQHDQKQKWWSGAQGPAFTIYREHDFKGIHTKERNIDAFFKNGIELGPKQYRQIAEQLEKDVEYLLANNINDYSVLLGVRFLDKKDYSCRYPARCRDCKSAPDQEYLPVAHLCLHFGIIDLLCPSNAKMQAFFLKYHNKYKKQNLTSMTQFTGEQLESVSPIPNPHYAGRFLGTVLGCIFHPRTHDSGMSSLRRALMSAICASYGAERKNGLEMLLKHVGQGPKMQHGEEGETSEAETGTGKSWMHAPELQCMQEGVTVHALDAFKEIMDTLATPSWDLLKSLASGPWNVLYNNREREHELCSTADRKYLLKKLGPEEEATFGQIFGEYYKWMTGPQGKQSLLPRYHALVRNSQKDAYLVIKNVFWPPFASGTFDHKFVVQSHPSRTTLEMGRVAPGLIHKDWQNHFPKGILMPDSQYRRIIEHLDQDAKFLAENNLTEYSMLISTEPDPKINPFVDLKCGIADILNQQQRKPEVTAINSYYHFMCHVSTKLFRSESDYAILANQAKYCVHHTKNIFGTDQHHNQHNHQDHHH